MAQSDSATNSEAQSFREMSANATVNLLEDPEKCPLCKQNFVDGHTTPCRHTFCGECIRNWMQFGLTCPACKTSLSVGDLSCATNNATGGYGGSNTKSMDNNHKRNERTSKIPPGNWRSGSGR